MLNDSFFEPVVPLTRPHRGRDERRRPSQRLAFMVCSWSIATATMVSVPVAKTTTSLSEVRIVPQVIVRTHPSPELTPEVLAAYRAAADDDVDLANAGLEEYAALIAAEEEAGVDAPRS